MLACQYCQTSLNRLEDAEFIVKCKNCYWVNRFRHGTLKKEKIINDSFKNPIMFKKQFGSGILYTYRIELRDIICLKGNSLKFGEAVEKFIFYDKDNLSPKEKNILYKLKAQSVSEINTKIEYLQAKKKCIELLKQLDF